MVRKKEEKSVTNDRKSLSPFAGLNKKIKNLSYEAGRVKYSPATPARVHRLERSLKVRILL